MKAERCKYWRWTVGGLLLLALAALLLHQAPPTRAWPGDMSAVWVSAEIEDTRAIAWADYDGDGDPDLAVGNWNQPVRVYRNDGGPQTGGGALTLIWSSAESANTAALAWGDFDGDGLPDLAVGNRGQPNRIYRNNGDDTFTLAWESAASDDTTSVAWADWDDDGDLDLAVGNWAGPNHVYRNNGDGTFTLLWSSTETDNTTALAWSDFDGDGLPDLAAGNHNAPARLYRNTGSGMTLVWSSPESSSTTAVAWADWNGDGKPDLAVGNYGVNRLYTNDGATLMLAWTSAESDTTSSLAWGDWDGDGLPDLAVGNEYHPNRIYRNTGGGFALAWSAPIAEDRTMSIAWADWDGNGDLDLAVGNGNGINRANRIYRNAGGALALDWTSLEADDTRALAWGDFDGDGLLDLAVGNAFGPNRLYRNTGDGYALIWTSPESDLTTSVAWGDFDGDGLLDLAVGNRGQPNRIYRNTGETLVLAWSSNESDNTMAVAWGDFDGDGRLDLAVANDRIGWFSPAPNRVYRNTGAGAFILAWTSPETEISTGIAWGDFDGDGLLDLAVANENSPTRVYRNTGAGFTSAWASAETDWSTGVAWADFDGDGRLDLAVSAENAPTCLYRNTGSGFNLVWSSAEQNNTTSLAWGDWDGDGWLDLVVGNRGQPNRIYRNDGATLTLAWSSPESDDTSSIAFGDADGDGDLDLAVGNGGGTAGRANRVYRNAGQPFAPAWSTPDRADIRALAWGDYDGDGWLDLALADRLGPTRIYRHTGAGLTLAHTITQTHGAATLAWGDWDGNGNLDLAIGGATLGLYVLQNDGDTFSIVWSDPGLLFVRSLAWGDADGDGLLDLAVARSGDEPNQVYRNTGAGLELAWTAPAAYNSRSVAWGDFDGDGLLDLAFGNRGQPNQVYRNTGSGFALVWESAESDITNAIAWGDLDGDGLPDLAVGNDGYSRIYRNTGSPAAGLGFVLAWSSPASNDTTDIAWGDWNNNGQLDLALANGSHAQVYRNAGGALQPVWASTDGPVASVAWGDWDNDGDLDLAAGGGNAPSRVYANRVHPAQALPVNAPTVVLGYPGAQAAAFYASAHIFEGAVAIPYTLHAAGSVPVREVRGFYSLDGGGLWLPAVPSTDTLTSNLATLPPGQVGITNTHVFTWNLAAQNFFGQADNVVFRIQAYPSLHNTAGPYQRPFGAGAQTFPFRARGSQVLVVDEGGLPVNGAQVYRLPAGASGAAAPVTDASGRALATNAAGYLPGRGALNVGDQLVALLPITATESYTLYHTSAAPTHTGLDKFTVAQPGVQTLLVSAANPLILFNLDLSLEWDARNDGNFLGDLALALEQSSAVLYDVTDGQMALGEVRVHQAKANWLGADIVMYAQNGIRPRATMGGIVGEMTDDVISATRVITNAYGPGQIRMGPNWDPFGQNLAELNQDWQRALAHEIAHYALFLPDNYLGFDANGFPRLVDCQGSFMTNTYDDAYSEFLTRDRWVGDCLHTIAEHTTGRTDWETVRAFYDTVHEPVVINPGPARLPLAVTRVTPLSPPAPAATLPPRFFDLRDAATGALLRVPGAQAYLFQVNDPADPTDDRLVPLGAALGDGDRIKVRGANVGDRLCVFAPYDARTQAAPTGCIEALSALDRSVPLAPAAGWQPAITVQAVTSRTLAVTVTLPVNVAALHAQIFPAYGPLTATLPVTAPIITLAPDPVNPSVFTQTITLAHPAFEGAVRVWQPGGGEAVTQIFLSPPWGPNRKGFSGDANVRAWGANQRQLGAPVASGDGQVTLFNLDDFFAETGILSLQALPALPQLPAWLTPVGQGYRVVGASAAARAIAFDYLQRDVPAGYEHTLRLYYSPDEGHSWQRLTTTLDTGHNQAIAQMPAGGEGIYALLAALELPALQPGWNPLSYPLPGARPVAEALASIEGAYSSLLFYEQGQWRLHDVAVTQEQPAYAAWLNDLTHLEFGRSYWLHATETITPYLGLPGAGVQSATFNPLPTIFYGPVSATAGFAPVAGMEVQATIGGALCGSGFIEMVGGAPAYKVQVRADAGDGCARAGQTVMFHIGGRAFAETFTLDGAGWTRGAWYQPLATGGYRVYLPLVRK